MTTAPYRERLPGKLVERPCPTCDARVVHRVTDTSAMCGACDSRFAIAIGELSNGRPYRDAAGVMFRDGRCPQCHVAARVVQSDAMTSCEKCGARFAANDALYVTELPLAAAPVSLPALRTPRRLSWRTDVISGAWYGLFVGPVLGACCLPNVLLFWIVASAAFTATTGAAAIKIRGLRQKALMA